MTFQVGTDPALTAFEENENRPESADQGFSSCTSSPSSGAEIDRGWRSARASGRVPRAVPGTALTFACRLRSASRSESFGSTSKASARGEASTRSTSRPSPFRPGHLLGRIEELSALRDARGRTSTVDHCIRKAERYAAAGLDHMICLMQADRIPHEKVMRSIELFAMEIMPRFR